MAENLLKHGFHLTVHERSERVRQWAAGRSGVRLTPSLRELGSASKFVLLLVTDHRGVNEVLYSAEGILAGLRRGSLVIDMTTGDPTVAVENHRKVTKRGVRFLEAPWKSFIEEFWNKPTIPTISTTGAVSVGLAGGRTAG